MNIPTTDMRVATVLTVYGIETKHNTSLYTTLTNTLQQCLPFTVLKLQTDLRPRHKSWSVATVLTVYGIETSKPEFYIQDSALKVATVLTVYGIETDFNAVFTVTSATVATVLTVYGIETTETISME